MGCFSLVSRDSIDLLQGAHLYLQSIISLGVMSWVTSTICARGICFSFGRGATLNDQGLLSCYSIGFLSNALRNSEFPLSCSRLYGVSVELWWNLLLNCSGAGCFLVVKFRLILPRCSMGLHSSCRSIFYLWWGGSSQGLLQTPLFVVPGLLFSCSSWAPLNCGRVPSQNVLGVVPL